MENIYRNKRIQRLGVLLILISIFLVCSIETALAHRLVIESLPEQELLLRYDDGTIASRVTVSGYTTAGDLLFAKQVEANGRLKLNDYPHVYRLVADDGIGHRAVWIIEKRPHSTWQQIPIWLRALAGVSILLFIAAVYYYRQS